MAEPRVGELVGDDREAGVDQIGRRADLDEPQHEVLRDRRGRVLGRDPRAPLGAHERGRAGRHHGGQVTRTGRGGLHCAPAGHFTGGCSTMHTVEPLRWMIGWAPLASSPAAHL